MKTLYLCLFLPAIFFLQLNSVSAKENLTDDPKTEFSAKVDGKVWNGGIVACNVEISSFEFFGFGDQNGMNIILNSPAGEGTFEISKKSKHKVSYGSTEENYTIGATDAGKVIITKYDKAKKLFSGTFEFTLTNEKTGKKVKITDGVITNMEFHDKPKSDFELTAKLNGARWKWMAANYNVTKEDTAYFSAAMNSDKYLHLKFPSNTQPGEYNITADGAFFAEYKSLKNRNDAGLLPKTGKLIILKNDGKKRIISGQFEIEMVNEAGETKARFTDGSFTMSYEE